MFRFLILIFGQKLCKFLRLIFNRRIRLSFIEQGRGYTVNYQEWIKKNPRPYYIFPSSLRLLKIFVLPSRSSKKITLSYFIEIKKHKTISKLNHMNKDILIL